jgi:hypothetical protein
MAQATHSIITRRSLVAATAAGVSAAAAAPLSTQAFAVSDPVLALIAAHKVAYIRFEQMCRFMSDLEGEIPEDKREEWFREDRAKGLGANDDPRWTAAKATYWGCVRRRGEGRMDAGARTAGYACGRRSAAALRPGI